MENDSLFSLLPFNNLSPFNQLYLNNFDEYTDYLNKDSDNYPDLSQYLDSLGNNVSKLLKNNNICHLIHSHHPQIISFLCNNIEDLILLSFDQSKQNARLSKLAYSILISGYQSINKALADEDSCVLKKMSNTALQKNDDFFSLKRLIQLIQFTIQVSYFREKKFPLSLSFICLFIPYIHEEFIYNFFEQVCSDFEYFTPVQEWLLKQANFPMIVIDELSKIKSKNIKNELQKASNLLKLVSRCLKSPVLSRDFSNYRLIELLNDDWPCVQPSDPLFDEIWIVINGLYSKSSATLMQGLFQKAVELLVEPYVTMRRFRVSVIDLITKMIVTDEALRPFIVSFHIEETVLRLLIQFPGHSFLQNSLLSLCCVAFEFVELRSFFARALIAPLINESMSVCDGKFVIAFTCEIIQKVVEIGQNDKKFLAEVRALEGFDNFYSSVVKKRNKLIKNGYGGRLPIFKNKPILFVS